MRRYVLVGLSIVAACSLAATPTVRELVARARKGPSLLLTRDMLPEIRRKAEADPDAKAWWKNVRKDADRALARPEAIPDRGGQWTLWYTCRGCGVMLKAESPTRHVCPKCGKAYSGWPFDDVYVSRVHSRLSRAVRDCGLMWLLTGEAKYATRVREILLGYAAAYDGYVWHSRNGPVDRPNKNGAARAAAQILDEAAWLIPILQGMDAVRDTLTPEDDARIISGLVKPSTETIRTECAKWSNHECWHLAAYGLSGLVQRDEALVDAALHSRYGAFNQLEHGILPDGCWYEGALHYHFYTMDAFTPFFQALRNLGMEPPRAYKRMFDAPFGQLAPDGQLPPVNDSWPTWFRPGDRAEHYELAYAWWGDPLYGWWVAQKPRRTMQYALWGRSGGKSDAAPLSLASRLYEASGIAVLRTQTPGRTRAGITPGQLPDDGLRSARRMARAPRQTQHLFLAARSARLGGPGVHRLRKPAPLGLVQEHARARHPADRRREPGQRDGNAVGVRRGGQRGRRGGGRLRRAPEVALGRPGGKPGAAPLSLASRLYEASGIAVLRTQTPGRTRAGITPCGLVAREVEAVGRDAERFPMVAARRTLDGTRQCPAADGKVVARREPRAMPVCRVSDGDDDGRRGRCVVRRGDLRSGRHARFCGHRERTEVSLSGQPQRNVLPRPERMCHAA